MLHFQFNESPPDKKHSTLLFLFLCKCPFSFPPQALVEFFQRVIDHQAKNKMTLNNVSVVMAPNIFMFKGIRSKVTEQQEFSMATSTANIVRLLIRYQNLLWTVKISPDIFYHLNTTIDLCYCHFCSFPCSLNDAAYCNEGSCVHPVSRSPSSS